MCRCEKFRRIGQFLEAPAEDDPSANDEHAAAGQPHRKPADQKRFDHAHESPLNMTIPLMTLAALPQTDARRLTQVSTSFGYGRVSGWLIAVLPRLYRQIRLPISAPTIQDRSFGTRSLVISWPCSACPATGGG